MTNAVNYIPAPWKISQKTQALTVESKKTGCRICQCSKDAKYTESQLASAILIAAAPELINFVNDFLEWHHTGGTLRKFSALVDRAETLVRKAEGK